MKGESGRKLQQPQEKTLLSQRNPPCFNSMGESQKLFKSAVQPQQQNINFEMLIKSRELMTGKVAPYDLAGETDPSQS